VGEGKSAVFCLSLTLTMLPRAKIIFLDRDGVINKFPGRGRYVESERSFKFISGSVSAIRRLTQAGFTIFVISNQGGVAKKLYSKDTLRRMTAKMLKKINGYGGKIRKVFYCTHLREDNCPCRKPKTAMIKKALKLVKGNIDRKNSYLIGDDTLHDITMGKKARLKTILVLSGKERLSQQPGWALQPDLIFKNLLQAAHFILKNNA
jgi:D-glycero-D-manno-heptose 1,7-bisphosphate phosphatase